MTGPTVAGIAGGALVTTGVLLLATARRPHQRRRAVIPVGAVLAAAAAGAGVLALTGWVAAALAAAAGAAAAATRRTTRDGGGLERLEALAAWTESLRDLVTAGVALREALPATVPAAGDPLRPALSRLVEAMRGWAPLEDALRGFADDLDDPGADLVVAALLLNTNAGGRGLPRVLSGVAGSLRAELTARRAVAADRAATRRGTRIVLAVTVLIAGGLRLFNPGYVEPYLDPGGQVALAGVVGLFAAGFVWMHRLSATPAPRRFLTDTAAGQR